MMVAHKPADLFKWEFLFTSIFTRINPLLVLRHTFVLFFFHFLLFFVRLILVVFLLLRWLWLRLWCNHVRLGCVFFHYFLNIVLSVECIVFCHTDATDGFDDLHNDGQFRVCQIHLVFRVQLSYKTWSNQSSKNESVCFNRDVGHMKCRQTVYSGSIPAIDLMISSLLLWLLLRALKAIW